MACFMINFVVPSSELERVPNQRGSNIEWLGCIKDMFKKKNNQVVPYEERISFEEELLRLDVSKIFIKSSKTSWGY